MDFIRFNGKRHPRELGVSEIRAYLSHLATEKGVAASNQTVALGVALSLPAGTSRGVAQYRKRRTGTPLQAGSGVFIRAEDEAILARLAGTHHLVIG